jgi:hypothetical protein
MEDDFEANAAYVKGYYAGIVSVLGDLESLVAEVPGVTSVDVHLIVARIRKHHNLPTPPSSVGPDILRAAGRLGDV